MTEQRPLKVFLCHASADKPAVRKLHRYLKQRGVQPWLDELDLLPGQDWQVEIPKAIFSSDVIVVCLSKNSVDKEGYVQKEITYALDKAMEKPEGTIFIIPAKLEECNVPNRLSRFHWVDLYREDGRKRLMLSLNNRAAQLGSAIQQASVLDDTADTIARNKAEREAAEKSAREKTEREAVAKAARQKAEHETAEKVAREKTEREAAEKAAREQAEREAAEKAAREKAERDAAEKAKRKKPEPPVSHTPAQKKEQEKKPARTFDIRKIGIAGIIIITLLFGFWGVGYLINQFSTLVSTPSVTSTDNNLVGTIDALVSSTLRARTASAAPTATLTHKPPTPTSTHKLSTPIPTLGIGSTKDGMTLVYVPAGQFTMGDDYYFGVSTIYLDSFWIDQTEVTNKMYALCIRARVCRTPKPDSWGDEYFVNSEYENYPMVNVDWYMAKTYCEWAGRRLPTEAEWEKASRGTDGRNYPWGNGVPDSNKGNFRSNFNVYEGYKTEVGQYPAGASPYGALDMAGNVLEWVSSLYQSYPYSATDGRENLNASGERVLRGGFWYDTSSDNFIVNSSWFRASYEYGDWSSEIGFRCALSE